ncbi:MAG: hypothetical protein NUV69_01345 [Candidatus Curtissbacteria bacterium]|nr:hypothetical protein [Candidatus Curtissbacteria bacterium]
MPPDTTPQPAHIHSGSCPTPGAIVYSLANVVDGESNTVLNTTMEKLKSQKPLAINVHKSQQEVNTYVACGNL